jgi:hypothetical protein
VHALVHAGPVNYEVAVAPAASIVLIIHLRLCRSLEAINLNISHAGAAGKDLRHQGGSQHAVLGDKGRPLGGSGEFGSRQPRGLQATQKGRRVLRTHRSRSMQRVVQFRSSRGGNSAQNGRVLHPALWSTSVSRSALQPQRVQVPCNLRARR